MIECTSDLPRAVGESQQTFIERRSLVIAMALLSYVSSTHLSFSIEYLNVRMLFIISLQYISF